jgi:protein TonB
MIARLLLTPLLLLAVFNLYSQDRLKDYSEKLNDTCWRVNYYLPSGPLVMIESYQDRRKLKPHGRFAWYDEKGWVDSAGFCIDGLRNGTWYYYNNKGKVMLSKEYEMGVVKSQKMHEADTASDKDATPVEGESESTFEGGGKGWQQYLNRNLRYPRDAIMAGIQGDVRVAFLVDDKGAIQDIWMIRSVARSLDEESMRLMKQSPLWIPAVKDGHRVKSYKIQPFRYRAQVMR